MSGSNAPEDHERFSFKAIVDPAVLPIGVFMLMVGLSYSGVITYLDAFADERNLMTGAGLFFVAYAIAMLITRFTLGKLQDRRGDNIVIYIGLLSFASSLVVLGLAHANWVVIVAGALCGLGYGTLMPASQAIAASSVPIHKMGTRISGLLLLTDFGVGIGPIVLGMLVSTTGFGGMYLMLAAVVIVAAVWYSATHGRKDVAKHGRHNVVETSEMEEAAAAAAEKVSAK